MIYLYNNINTNIKHVGFFMAVTMTMMVFTGGILVTNALAEAKYLQRGAKLIHGQVIVVARWHLSFDVLLYFTLAMMLRDICCVIKMVGSFTYISRFSGISSPTCGPLNGRMERSFEVAVKTMEVDITNFMLSQACRHSSPRSCGLESKVGYSFVQFRFSLLFHRISLHLIFCFQTTWLVWESKTFISDMNPIGTKSWTFRWELSKEIHGEPPPASPRLRESDPGGRTSDGRGTSPGSGFSKQILRWHGWKLSKQTWRWKNVQRC